MVYHATVIIIGEIASEDAVGHGGTAKIMVMHPAGSPSRVIAEGAVGHRWAALWVVTHPAARVGHVIGEGAVGHGGTALIVVHPAAIRGRGSVAGEGAVSHRWAAVIIFHPTAISLSPISVDLAVADGGVRIVVINCTTIPVCFIPSEGAVGDKRIGPINVNSTPYSVWKDDTRGLTGVNVKSI